MLAEKIRNRESGVILYGITPPKSNNTDERVAEIAAKQSARISSLPIDGLIIYDLQDETARTNEERPFEFVRTVDPSVYSHHYLASVEVPKIVYRCVGNYEREEFVQWLEHGQDDLSVYVGTAAMEQEVKLSLDQAYDLRKAHNDDMVLGAVTIPERHMVLGDEDKRVGFKMSKGCKYFVSQAVYDVAASKKFLRDYKAYCEKEGIEMVPVIFTLTPCGSPKTLKFIKWLGISVPEWLESTLLSTEEMLDKSMDLIKDIYKELWFFAKDVGIPIGFNIESVSVRKVEIDASVQLVKDLESWLRERGER